MVSFAGGEAGRYLRIGGRYSSIPLECWWSQESRLLQPTTLQRHSRRSYPDTRYLAILNSSLHTARTQAIHEAVSLSWDNEQLRDELAGAPDKV